MKDVPPSIDTMIQEGLANMEARSRALAPQDSPQRSQFASLGHKSIDAMVKAAEDVVARAQEGLEAIKERAVQMRTEIDERDQELAVMMQRVTDFGNDQLSAHAKFNGDERIADFPASKLIR